jgi:hypothetical protein
MSTTDDTSFFSTTELRSSFKIPECDGLLELKETALARKPVENEVSYWRGNSQPWRSSVTHMPIQDDAIIAYEESMMARVVEEDGASDFNATMLRNKGINVSFLFAFTCELDLWEWKTMDVVRFLIKPVTERYDRCRFADLDFIAPHTGDATVFLR